MDHRRSNRRTISTIGASDLELARTLLGREDVERTMDVRDPDRRRGGRRVESAGDDDLEVAHLKQTRRGKGELERGHAGRREGAVQPTKDLRVRLSDNRCRDEHTW